MPEGLTLDYRDPEWVAKRLGIDKNSVYRYLDKGILPGLRLGRKWLISEASLAEFLKRQEEKQTEARRDSADSDVDLAGEIGLAEDPSSDRAKRKGGLTLEGFIGKDRFGKFSERARRVLSSAREQALGLNHEYIDTEHILLGLVRETEGVGARVLGNLGVADKIPAAVESTLERGERPASGEVSLRPLSRKVIKRAVQEARYMRSPYIGTEHLLLGLMREPDGAGSRILDSLGVSLEGARTEIVRILDQAPPHRPPRKHKKREEGSP